MRPLMQLGCIFLLLYTQQIALTHTLWHAAGADDAHVEHSAREHGHDGDGDSDAQRALCTYHLAFDTLLGGHNGSIAVLLFPAHGCAPALLPGSSLVAAEAVPAVSRGPPILL
jgi:hypothetical protein